MTKVLENWTNAKKARVAAEKWNDKPNSEHKYQGDSFSISIAHCKAPILVRAGQHSCGGQNYWETEKPFNSAILEHIVENWDSIYLDVIKRMKHKENFKLQECQSFIDDMQEKINLIGEDND